MSFKYFQLYLYNGDDTHVQMTAHSGTITIQLTTRDQTDFTRTQVFAANIPGERMQQAISWHQCMAFVHNSPAL